MGDDDGRAKKENLSQSYAEPGIAAKQREIVKGQLAAMRAGDAPQHFAVLGDVLRRIRLEDGHGALRLLDAGCGSAYYSEILNHFDESIGLIEYTGCDYNPGMIALAKETYPDLPIYECDVRKLIVFNDAVFDIVLSGATIIHIHEWRVVLKELTRVSRRWLVLHRTWVHTDGTPTTREIHDAYGQDVWYQTFDEVELLEQVRKLNFDLVDTYPTGEGIRRGRVLTYLFRKLERVRETSDRAGMLQSTEAYPARIRELAAA